MKFISGIFFLPKAEVLSLHESEAAQSCPGPLSFENPRLARCLCSMPDTHMGGRLSDLGAQLVGVGEVTPSCCCLSRLGSERFPLAPDPGHVRGSRLPTRVEQTHFCAASLCLPPCLQLGQLELLLLVIRKKKKKVSLSLDGVVCAFIDLVTGTTAAFLSPGRVISARALEQGPAPAAGVFPVLLT